MLKIANRPVDVGILVIRLGIGFSMLIFHGYGKLAGGIDAWEKIGTNMKVLGITFLPVFWGFMAAFSESICSVLIITGVLFRPAAALLAFTMIIAALRHLTLPDSASGSGWSGASHALEYLAVYAGLLLTGSGHYILMFRK